jgi:hypothetical protein
MADSRAIICPKSSTNNPTPAVQTSTTALAANANRCAWRIQNLSTNPLFVLLGTGATSSQYHAVLSASVVAADGTGGVWNQSDGIVYTGIITIAGTSPSYVVLEV